MATVSLLTTAPFVRPVTPEQSAELVVHAINDDDAPAVAFPVVFTVLRGGFGLGPERAKTLKIETDSNGRAATTASVMAPGAGVVTASLENGEEQVRFMLRTPGVSNDIDMAIDGPVTADDGVLRVRLHVRDVFGEPVRQASIVVIGHTLEDVAIRGDAISRGDGAYEAVLAARYAGDWTLVATDRSSHASAVRRVNVLPGRAVRIATAHSDPRSESPYDRAVLRARVEDAAGNALDPTGLVASIDGMPLKGSFDGEGATFPIQQAGAGDVRIELTDRRTGLSATAAVPFAHFWMMLPDIVRPGATYRAEVRALPSRERTFETGRLTVGFDPQLVAFAGHHASEQRMVSLTGPVVSDRTVSFGFKSERPIEAAEFPEGIQLGEIEWSCKGEGMTCFDVGGAMSPGIPGWVLCMPQKEEAINRQCICINIIYFLSRPSDRLVGYEMAQQIVDVISANIYFCCPLVTFRRRIEIIDENSEAWQDATEDWMGDVPWDADDVEAVFNSGIGQREDCLNLYVLDLSHANLAGLAQRPGLGYNGSIAVDPNAFRRLNNVAAHEAGHALGLDHHDDGFGLNLMTPGGSANRNAARRGLARWQCEIIWRNLGSYPC